MPFSPELFDTGFLDVGDGHRLYYEQSGNPAGEPALYLHGGPGGGSHPAMRGFFNQEHYRVILFDQRGAGRSTPQGSTEHNTPSDLIADIEKIRLHLGIEKWLVAGGSWGSALSLFYALAHPQRVTALVLSGIFFADQKGARWLAEEGGASEIMPEWFAPYRDFIPPEQRAGGLGAAYHRIMEGGDPAMIREAARRFALWDTAILHFDLPLERLKEVEDAPEEFIPLSKIYFHYMVHYFRDENKARILAGVRSLAHVPCDIIHGRYDLICPVRGAFELHQAFPGSRLHILDKTGHTAREPAIAAKILEVTNSLAGIHG